MDENELITYNGKQYKVKDLPPEVQSVLKDENNNGIPDRLEPQLGNSSAQAKIEAEELSSQTQPQAKYTDQHIESVSASLTKKYLATTTLTLIGALAIGIVLFILIFFAGVALN